MEILKFVYILTIMSSIKTVFARPPLNQNIFYSKSKRKPHSHFHEQKRVVDSPFSSEHNKPFQTYHQQTKRTRSQPSSTTIVKVNHANVHRNDNQNRHYQHYSHTNKERYNTHYQNQRTQSPNKNQTVLGQRLQSKKSSANTPYRYPDNPDKEETYYWEEQLPTQLSSYLNKNDNADDYYEDNVDYIYTDNPIMNTSTKETPTSTTTTIGPFDISDIKVPVAFLRQEYMISFTFLGVMYGLGFLVLAQSILVPTAKSLVAIIYWCLLKSKAVQPISLQHALHQMPPA